MKIDIKDPAVHKIGGLLGKEGYETRLVGGAVRDIVSGVQPKDLDLATDALPETVMEIALKDGHRVIPTGLQHGTVTIVMNGDGYEVTTLRRDVETDGRHASVEYVSDFKIDAARRDFTFNAMSASLDGEVHDHFGGIDDLKAGRVRFVGDARSRIEEDYLRILRFFRFRARYGGQELPEDLMAISTAKQGLARISVERIWSEVSRIIMHPNGERQLEAMASLGVSDVIGLPVDLERHQVASAVVKSGGQAGTILGVLAGRRGAAEELGRRWRVSLNELQDAIVAAETLNDHSADPHHWLCKATDGLVRSRAIPVLLSTGREEAAKAIDGEIPHFPVAGRHLFDLCEKGPQMGSLLNELKDEWKASGFTMSMDDLVELAAAKTSIARRP